MKIIDAVIAQAEKAKLNDEIPVGAVIVSQGKIIARAFNQREKLNCALAHAEILAINKACKKVKNWRLVDAQLYVSLKPCVMCAGAIVQAKISKVFYFTESDKDSNLVEDIFLHNETGNKVECKQIDDGGRSKILLQEYFLNKRGK